MKSLLITLLSILVIPDLHSQQYKEWSLSAGIGNTFEIQVLTFGYAKSLVEYGAPFHFELAYQQRIKEKLKLGILLDYSQNQAVNTPEIDFDGKVKFLMTTLFIALPIKEYKNWNFKLNLGGGINHQWKSDLLILDKRTAIPKKQKIQAENEFTPIVMAGFSVKQAINSKVFCLYKLDSILVLGYGETGVIIPRIMLGIGSRF